MSKFTKAFGGKKPDPKADKTDAPAGKGDKAGTKGDKMPWMKKGKAGKAC